MTATGNRMRDTVLQTAKVGVEAADGSLVTATVVFDTGAECSYVSSQFRKKLRPKLLGHDWVSYGAFGGESASTPSLSPVFLVQLKDMDGWCHTVELAEVPIICPPLERTPVPAQVLEQFTCLGLADEYGRHKRFHVDVLIGQDYYWTLVEFNTGQRRGALVALSTPFGYLLSGAWGSGRHEARASTSLLAFSSPSAKAITQFWELDSLGISPTEAAVDHLEHHPVLERFIRELEYCPEQRRYQVSAMIKNEADKTLLRNNVS